MRNSPPQKKKKKKGSGKNRNKTQHNIADLDAESEFSSDDDDGDEVDDDDDVYPNSEEGFLGDVGVNHNENNCEFSHEENQIEEKAINEPNELHTVAERCLHSPNEGDQAERASLKSSTLSELSTSSVSPVNHGREQTKAKAKCSMQMKTKGPTKRSGGREKRQNGIRNHPGNDENNVDNNNDKENQNNNAAKKGNVAKRPGSNLRTLGDEIEEHQQGRKSVVFAVSQKLPHSQPRISSHFFLLNFYFIS